ncbi:MAG: chloride channel protein [Anaerolineae bacterium]|nr:chloride channel protein [Anaerolineae bacterium]MCO5200035.1 chloride channel protein [Anaerolineae bacterium]
MTRLSHLKQRYWIEPQRSGFRLLSRIRFPDGIVMMGLAVIVGIGTALGAVVFVKLLRLMGDLTVAVEVAIGSIAGLFLVMGLGGLIVGYMINRWASEAKGHGVPEVMEAIGLRGGRIRPIVAVVKVIASAITIGVGGSAGREGPIVQVGSALGSSLGQVLDLSRERIITLVACGSAAGIAATFNAPIAGAIFALEVILGQFSVRYFGAVVISAVSASIVAQAFLGNRPAFNVPSYALNHLGEIPIYITLGVLSALWAVLFIRILYRIEGMFDHWHIPLAIKTTIGMLLTAAIALPLVERQVLGPGLEFIGESIAEDFGLELPLLFALLIFKLLATSFTLGSGNSGGVFAPSLFMGAILGAIVGTISNRLWPDVAINPGAYAIVGMASVFAGAARAPITAILIVFEMSSDYKLILPLMMSTVLATVLAEAIFPESIYTLKLKLKGVSLHRGRDNELLDSVLVNEIMRNNVPVMSPETTLGELSQQFAETHGHGFPVVDDDNNLRGVVTISDLERAWTDGVPHYDDAMHVIDIATPYEQLLFTFPDETMGQALERMGHRDLGRLPVVARENSRQFVGLIRRADIIRAYNLGLARRDVLRHRVERAKVEQEDAEFVDIVLDTGDAVVGKSLSEIATNLPRGCVLISVTRAGRVVIPHGQTVFLAGDHITAFVRKQDRAEYMQAFGIGSEA